VTERFDYLALVDELSCRDTSWLLDHRDELVREQRRLHVRELAVVAVLDRRGAVGDATAAEDGISVRSLRDTVETARRLESLPEVAAAAYHGAVSGEQLTPLAQLADPESDAEWAQRAPHTSPADLARKARTTTKPTAAEYAARHAARSVRMWWDATKQFLHLHGQFAAIDGGIVETTLNDLVDQARPANNESWASREQRAADALVGLCRRAHDHEPGADPATPTVSARHPLLVVEVPLAGPAELCGIPLPDTVIEQLRANARIEPVLVDDLGVPITRGRVFPALSPKITRAVLLRDGHCRWPGCDRRHGLQVHHLWPRSWGGTDTIADPAAVCAGGSTAHHPMLVPHGPCLLLDNPNHPDGLRLIHRDKIPAGIDPHIQQRRPPTLADLGLEHDHPGHDHPDIRAGPTAA
jgi:hypothetical protein